MNEIAQGVFHWTAEHPNLHAEVSSYYLAESGTLLDPMVPADGLGWFEGEHVPQAIVLSNRHHDRQAEEFVRAFGLGPALVPDNGLHEYEDKALDVRGYAVGEEVVPGVIAHPLGAPGPDDVALELRSAGALLLGDALMHYGGSFSYVPDKYMDDPEGTKRKLHVALEELLDLDIDTLLFAHGTPLVGGGKQALREFLAA